MTRHQRILFALQKGFISRKWANYLIKRRATHEILDAALYLAEVTYNQKTGKKNEPSNTL